MQDNTERKVRVGMVGGAPGAGIAETHRTAMRIDDRYDLVAGVFSRDPAKSLAAARKLRLGEDRVYSMAEFECKRQDGIDAAIIVTPTDSYYRIARAFLESGTNVIRDKPLCLSVAEARELNTLAEKGRINPLSDAQLLRLRDGASRCAHGKEWRFGRNQSRSSGTRIGLGHPEGFFETFANLHTEVADALLAKAEGEDLRQIRTGLFRRFGRASRRAFVEGAMRSYATGGAGADIESN